MSRLRSYTGEPFDGAKRLELETKNAGELVFEKNEESASKCHTAPIRLRDLRFGRELAAKRVCGPCKCAHVRAATRK